MLAAAWLGTRARGYPAHAVPLHVVPRHSQPVSGLPSQSTQSGEHESMWQVPFWHDDVAKYVEHAVPQPPQL